MLQQSLTCGEGNYFGDVTGDQGQPTGKLLQQLLATSCVPRVLLHLHHHHRPQHYLRYHRGHLFRAQGLKGKRFLLHLYASFRVSERERGRVCECSDVIYLRLSLQWRAESDMKDTCFICSRNSYDFEHHGKVGKARMQLSIISIFFFLHTFYSLVLYSSLCHLFYTPP